MNKLALVSDKLTYATLFILALAIFTSNSVSAASHIFALIPGIYLLVKAIQEKTYATWSKSTWMLLLMFLSVVLSVVFNLDIIDRPMKNIFKGKYFIFAFFWVLMFQNFFKNEIDRSKFIKVLLWTFLIATSIASLSGVVAMFTGMNYLKMKPGCHATRACGLYGMYMTYGYGISLFVILNAGLLVYRDKIKEYVPTWLVALSFLINFAGLYFSYARGGLLAFVFALPFFLLKKNPKKFLIGMLGGGLLLGSAILFVPKLNTVFLKRGGSNDQRIAFFQTAVKAWQEKPIFGYGYRNFEPNVKRLKKKYNIGHQYFGGHAHNNVLEHLASTGLLGAIFIILFHIFWVLEMFKRDDLLAMIALPFVVNFATSGLFQYTFGDGENLFLIFAIYALSQVRIAAPVDKGAV